LCNWFGNAFLAINAANPGLYFSPNNQAVGDETQGASFAKAQIKITNAVKFAHWKTCGGSFSTSVAVITQFNTYFQAFITLCQSLGVTPILATRAPSAQFTTSDADNGRLTVNQSCRTIVAGSGGTMILADYDPTFTQPGGASPATMVPAYTDDQVHYNETGSAVAASVLQAAVQAYINSH
jgi:hypothetical protein